MRALPTVLKGRVLLLLQPSDRASLYEAVPQMRKDVPRSAEYARMKDLDRLHAQAFRYLEDREWFYAVVNQGIAITWLDPDPQNAAIARLHCASRDAVDVGEGRRVPWDAWFRFDARVRDTFEWNEGADAGLFTNAFFRDLRTFDLPRMPDHDAIQSFMVRRAMFARGGDWRTPAPRSNALEEALANNAAFLLTQIGMLPRLCFRIVDGCYEVCYEPIRRHDERQWYFIDAGEVFIVDPTSVEDCKEVLKRVLLRCVAMEQLYLERGEDEDEEDEEEEDTVGESYPSTTAYHDPNATLGDPGLVEIINDDVGEYRMRLASNVDDVRDALRYMGATDMLFKNRLPLSATGRGHIDYNIFLRLEIPV